MWIGILFIPLMLACGMIAIAVCVVAGRVNRMEELEQQIDSTAARLLEGIEIDL